MNEIYCGVLAEHDPLYDFLRDKVYRDVLGIELKHAIFDVYAMHPQVLVCRYHERTSGVNVACKFYGNKLPSHDASIGVAVFTDFLEREFANMHMVWNLGFQQAPFRTVQPLAIEPNINYVLVEEFVEGPSLDHFFSQGFESGDLATIAVKIADLARFLAELHQRSFDSLQLAPLTNATGYLSKIRQQLSQKSIIDTDTSIQLDEIGQSWAESGKLEGIATSLLHGDATPINFIFRDNHEVIAIDLERVHRGDAMKDLGCVLAEVWHACWLHGQSRSTAEALLAQIYVAYTAHWPAITQQHPDYRERSRFWLGVTLLRICRNDWLTLDYRYMLVKEALAWLG